MAALRAAHARVSALSVDASAAGECNSCVAALDASTFTAARGPALNSYVAIAFSTGQLVRRRECGVECAPAEDAAAHSARRAASSPSPES
eukprot:CAMPEP_0183375340 /NCGR_PEP_ID=MMETSP0164_2-20130417/117057_1 /TAXON_ID=221442 /ORGANISM="Coccolithus pelagicus ssp braarudi, Strain PLY182g" /LENGTH=89 /DNA_ID=CAMNT_0025552503 /DNA_START=12 /DNA_END=281 /DNA_ORIENTATION=+